MMIEKITNKTEMDHAQRHINQLEKLIQERPSDPWVPKWKSYLAQYRIQLEFYRKDILLREVLKNTKKRLLTLRKGWDGDQAPPFQQNHLDFIESLLIDIAFQLYTKFSLECPIPEILPTPEGDILVEWIIRSTKLSITILDDPEDYIIFYFKEPDVQKISAYMNREKLIQEVELRLTQLLSPPIKMSSKEINKM